MPTLPQLVVKDIITLLAAGGNYQRVFMSMGVIPPGYSPASHAYIETKTVRIDVAGQTDIATAIDLTTNELAKTNIHIDKNSGKVTPFAIEIDESGLSSHNFVDDAVIASITNHMMAQSDVLHKTRLLSIANALPQWTFDATTLRDQILEIINNTAMHFPVRSRKILYLPEVLMSKLVSMRLASDETKSQFDILRNICTDYNISIDPYVTLADGVVDIILVQFDSLAYMPGNEPFMRRQYEHPNGLTKTHQFLFSVAALIPNAQTVAANAHVVTHLPVILPTAAATASMATMASSTLPLETSEPTPEPKAKK